MSAALHTPADVIDAKGLQSRSLRGQKAVIDARLHEGLKVVLLVLLSHHNDQSGLCCPGQDLIAAKLGVTENTVRARLRKIEQRGLVTVHRMGRWTRYTIHFNAIDALEPAAAPVDNSRDTLKSQHRHPQITVLTPANHDADTLKICALTGKGTGYSTEGGTEARAGAAVDSRTFPPLLDLKTEDPAALAIRPDTLAAINAKYAAAGLQTPDLVSMTRSAQLFCTTPQLLAESILKNPTIVTPTDIVARSLQHLADDLVESSSQGTTLAQAVSTVMTGLAESILRSPDTEKFRGAPAQAVSEVLLTAAETVVEPVVAPAASDAPAAPAPAAEHAVAIAPETLAAVNAQRTRNGKRPFQRADLVELSRQATLAGITPQAAAELILANPSWNFFMSSYHKPATGGVVAAPVALLDEATRAAARARADQVQADLLRRSIEAMRAPVLVGQPAPERRSARSAVIPRHAAPISVGAATGTGWARDAVVRFTSGQSVNRATIASAAVALGLPLADLKAQRAAHLAAVAA